MDSVDKLTRSKIMSRVRGKNTTPELIVRSVTHAMGYRFRLHRKDLPGKPDLVFPGRKKIVLVNGCFWHLHSCERYKIPKTNEEFWLRKLKLNQQRDQVVEEKLKALGWSVLTIWECEIKDKGKLERILTAFLGPAGQPRRSICVEDEASGISTTSPATE